MTYNESDSCNGGVTFGEWYDANNSETTICAQFGSMPTANAINIDFLLSVPIDARNLGSQGDVVTCRKLNGFAQLRAKRQAGGVHRGLWLFLRCVKAYDIG